MPALLESTASYLPDYEVADWRAGPASIDPLPQTSRHRHLRLVDSFQSVIEYDRPLDAAEEQTRKVIDRAVKNARALRDAEDRIRALATEAVVSGQPYSVDSAVDVVTFLRSLSITQRPSIYLLDNGNFQAVWRNVEKEQVSLQFFGKNVVQFAMFARRQDLPMARIAGKDNADQIRLKLTDHGCRHLIV
jgi:hypothetical protein